MIGNVIGEYKILSEIGRGGMGIVYLAEHFHLRQTYALKILPEELSHDKSFIQHFYTEARTMASLKHPGIVQVVYMGKEEDLYYLIMEYVVSDTGKPKNLQELVREKGGKLSPGEMDDFMQQICAALSFAHGYRDTMIKEGIVHRDLKPSNILLARNNKVKLSDFGLAKVVGDDFMRSRIEKSMRTVKEEKAGLDETATFRDFLPTTTEAIMGTYEFMSPEQKAGRKIDHRSDIFSLGVVVYSLLTGKKPVGRFKNPSELDPSIPRVWDTVVERCLQESPDDRFQDVTEISDLLKGKGAPKKKPAPTAALVAGGLAIIVAGSIFGYWWFRRGEPARARPEGEKAPIAKAAPTAKVPGPKVAGRVPVEGKAAPAAGIVAKRSEEEDKAARADALAKEMRYNKKWYNKWYDQGIEKMLSGDREQALLAFERALEYKETEQARDQIAKIKYEDSLREARALNGQKEYQAAGAAYRKALTFMKTAEAERGLKETREAMEKEELDKKREELFRKHVAQARQYEAQSRFKEAISAYRAALQYKPENAEIKACIPALQRKAVPVSPRMVLIKEGKFWMGSDSARAKDNERPRHQVYLDNYYIDKYEVTNKEYERFDPAHRRTRGGGDKAPVTKVSWEAAMAYCAWRAEQEGLPEGTYRLPTEAEWERAAKGGALRSSTGGAYSAAGLKNVNSGSPNAYGLYNMPGNAWEWCYDWYDERYYAAGYDLGKNPEGASWGTTRSVRDAALGRTDIRARVTSRMGLNPSANDIKMLGFRCVRIE